MEILLALAAAVSYGVSDFAGGVLTRRAHVFVVFLLSQLVSFTLLLVVVALWADAVSWPGVGWGAAAGLAGVVGTSLLYQGLAIGRMSVVAQPEAALRLALRSSEGTSHDCVSAGLLRRSIDAAATGIVTATALPSAAHLGRCAPHLRVGSA